MHSKLLSIIFIAIIFCLLIPIFHQPTLAYSETQIQLKDDVRGRFQLHSGETVIYITLLKGQHFQATSVNEKNWSIQVGNAQVTIPKRATTSSNKKLTTSVPTNKLDVMTKNCSVNVYLKPSNHSGKMARMVKNMRLSTNGKEGDYYEVIIGGQKGYIHHSDVEIDNGVPVLIYHHLNMNSQQSDYKNISSALDIKLFNEQMQFLKKNNYSTITLKDLDLWMQRKQALPGKAVALTFDDANLSIEKLAYPILKEKKMKATTFIIGSRVKDEAPEFIMDKVQFAGFNELQMIQDVFELESHTFALHEFNYKTNRALLEDATADQLQKDFDRFHEVLQKIDPTITSRYYCYPFGKFNKQYESILRKNGVSLAFLNKGGKAKFNSPRLYVPRIPVQANMSLQQFKNAIAN